ncbi:MAG: YidC/Oxa1 family membrane protein insertase [Actinomycetota bacterium]
MANVWGAIEKIFGGVLSGIYGVVPQYGVAIILLTILVRLILFPLGVKQIRSMTAMQRIQPKLKELQKKHKGDRQKLNEEMMKLYKEHGVNPLGGCLPTLLQMPALIALYAVIGTRSAITLSVPVDFQKVTIPTTKDTVCRPAEIEGSASVTPPQLSTANSTTLGIQCKAKNGQVQDFTIPKDVNITRDHSTIVYHQLPILSSTGTTWITKCLPPALQPDGKSLIARCQSPLGTGHIGDNSKLFKALVEDKATFLGMHLSCSPTQALSKKTIGQCTSAQDTGAGGPVIAVYFLLVVLMAGTTWYQQKQMMSRQSGAASSQAAQMQMMGKIMPLFMGYLAIVFPTALSLYWVVGNFWMIGQQHLIYRGQDGPDGGQGAIVVKSKPRPDSPNGKQGKSGSKNGSSRRSSRNRPSKSRR